MVDDEGRRVLLTGISGPLAGCLAQRLEDDESVTEIIAVDTDEPRVDLRRTEFVRADLRNPLVSRIVETTGVDTVVHTATVAGPRAAGGRARMKEQNVIGAMQLLAAAQKQPRLRRLVVKSTTAVYGANKTDRAVFGEDAEIGGESPSGYTKDAVETEGYVRALARRRDDVEVTIFRFANLVGPTVRSPLTRYLSLPVVPTVLGYDPRMQLCHEDDAVEVLYRATVADGTRHTGTYNVAGPGIVYLSQALRIAGRPSVPVLSLFADTLAGALRRTGRVDFSPDQLRFLLYGRVGDITRLREEFPYEPSRSTREALADFVAAQRVAPLIDRATAVRWERELYDFVTRKGQERFMAGSPRSGAHR